MYDLYYLHIIYDYLTGCPDGSIPEVCTESCLVTNCHIYDDYHKSSGLLVCDADPCQNCTARVYDVMAGYKEVDCNGMSGQLVR